MHINFKYFIVSIGSIFIALGIGILIGSSLSTNEAIQEQNSELIKDIDTRFAELQGINDGLIAENKSLIKDIDNLKLNLEKYSSEAMSGVLSGKNIGIISFDEESTSEHTKNAITSAGGNISFNITIKPTIVEKDSIKKINEKFGTKLTKKDEVVNFALDAVKTFNIDNKLSQLQELGFIKVNSQVSSFDSTNNVVINNTYNSKNKDFVDFEYKFVDSIKSSKHTLLAQVSESSVDLFEKYSKLKVPTLSNVDEKLGQLSLVVLLNTKADGNYGKNAINYSYMPVIN